jgi:hypothetical protein
MILMRLLLLAVDIDENIELEYSNTGALKKPNWYKCASFRGVFA